LRKLIQLYGFWYGCLGSLCALAWYVTALRGSFSFPSNWGIVIAVFVLHGIAACFTFQPHVRPLWQPLLAVTQIRVRLARGLFGLATLNFAVWFGAFIVAGNQRDQLFGGRVTSLILTSFLLQNTVYIALRWAFRPENLFPGSFIEALSNPLGSVLGLFSPRFKKR
jgi:hypothetical protein